ncbi:MAG: PIN domain-containing protein [Planctomycetota bacterium]|nr:PIN domain-containing protein [Planctomycetota bacterium]
MKVLFDTSALVPALVPTDPRHDRAYPWLDRALGGKSQLVLCAHTLAETYAVLTGLPIRPRIRPEQARDLVAQLAQAARVVSLSPKDYMAVLDDLARKGWTGGVVFDALLVRAAQLADVDQLVTYDQSDFLRIWPEGRDRIVCP